MSELTIETSVDTIVNIKIRGTAIEITFGKCFKCKTHAQLFGGCNERECADCMADAYKPPDTECTCNSCNSIYCHKHDINHTKPLDVWYDCQECLEEHSAEETKNKCIIEGGDYDTNKKLILEEIKVVKKIIKKNRS